MLKSQGWGRDQGVLTGAGILKTNLSGPGIKRESRSISDIYPIIQLISSPHIITFNHFAILFLMLYGYSISNITISNAKIGPLFYFTLNIEYLYNRVQTRVFTM